MHLSKFVTRESFAVRVGEDGNRKSGTLEDLFPDWGMTERLGIVLSKPYGAIEASLALLAMTPLFYGLVPERATTKPQYPPIFLFHIDRMHGSHIMLDVVPHRYEVLVENDPYAVLTAVKDYGITRLMVPDEHAEHDLSYVERAPLGWTDLRYLRENLRSVYAYGQENGFARSSDIEITSADPRLEESVTQVLRPEESIKVFSDATEESLAKKMIGETSLEDLEALTPIVAERMNEVRAEERARLLADRVGRRNAEGNITQAYRKLSVDDGLSRLVP
ncbi:hypothetical protein FJ661_19605 [Pseudarthrobacter phenanthrenivorans]|nr:hypothetical protein [Pseudarthrobacter phenanthrenivorans]TPV48095.1 hypothetical protein FJ661_19605 [Pseudarthrobacter phenanthrenivorans]